MNYRRQTYASPVGNLTLVAKDDRLCGVVFDQMWDSYCRRYGVPQHPHGNDPVLDTAEEQLAEYFRGDRQSFDLPLQIDGTAFQQRTWSTLASVNFGETTTYKHQAQQIGAPNSVRAVGRANGLNPLCIILPCHRVVASNGALSGYAGGIEAKRFLLALETGSAISSKETIAFDHQGNSSNTAPPS